ncbi:MAG: T9SS type A sorting domain-containing protein [Pseudoflavonifractor sp.]|nr:T9SS type A sorting domain-containing protein [Pseudoflavonifractor sp.]
MLRSIAVALGFGGSVIEKTVTVNSKPTKLISFATMRGTHTPFDTIIFNHDNVRLSDIPNTGPRNNSALNNYVQPTGDRYIYALKEDETHRMFAPEVFEPFKSLVYLDNPTSLMHYDVAVGDKYMQIDGTTIELLNAIGWQIPVKEIEIIGENIASNGIASAYEPHRFHINNCFGKELSEISWTLALPLKDGGMEIVAAGRDCNEFNIPAITDEDRYEININGDIYGQVVCTAIADGQEVKDVYRISLELKPRIKKVTILRKEQRKPYASYDLYYTVEYCGASQILTELDEEYSSSLIQQYVREPFLAHVITPYISAPAYAWIDITAENKYGKDTYTIELEPAEEFMSGNRIMNTTEISNDSLNENISYLEIYSIAGARISVIKDMEDLKNLRNGIYILNIYGNDGTSKQIKYVRQ